MTRFNLSRILAILGAVGVLAPDLTGLAAYLAGLGAPWLVTVAHGLGGLALFLASAPRVIAKMRPVLAALNLATPAGEAAPSPAIVVQPEARDPQKGAWMLFVVLAALAVPSCKTSPTSPDSFFNVIVTCTEANTNDPAASAAVLGCLTAAVGGDYAACLGGLVTAGHWTVDEVACIVRNYATTSAQRINLGTPRPTDAAAFTNGNAWIRAEKIGYR